MPTSPYVRHRWRWPGRCQGRRSTAQDGFDGPIVLFAAEDHLPYERPPLSKDYLAGKKALDDFFVHAAAGTPSTTSTCASAPR